jgi:hypothetical protein
MDREVLDARRTIAGANLLNNYITRIDQQLEFALEEIDRFNATIFSDMAMAIARASADKKARMVLIARCSDLIKHLLRTYPLPKLTQKKIALVHEAILHCMGSHFGSWEELMQKGAVKVVSNLRVLDEDVGLDESLVGQVADIMDTDRSEKLPKGSWKERRKERLQRRASEYG